MLADRILDLRDAGEFRQTLAARPPAIVHGTVVILGLLVATAVVWASLTEANLVVTGAARVRPAVAPLKSFDEVSNEQVYAETSGRIREIAVTEGQHVSRGDILVQLDAARVSNEIGRVTGEIEAGEAELAAMARMTGLLEAQFEAGQARVDAEISRARHSVHRSRARMLSDAKLSRVDLDDAIVEQARARDLLEHKAGAAADLAAADARVARAREKGDAAQIGVDDGEPEVLRRSLEQAARDHQVKLAELARERAVKRGQVDASRKQLANLELERDHATLRAHTTGIVTLGGLSLGDVVSPGKLPLAITSDGGLRIDAAISPVEVAHLAIGMPVRVKLDAYDYQRYGTVDGTITHIASDTAVAASPNGGRAAYYLVSVAISRDEIGSGEWRGPLKVGMTGQVEAITGRERLISLFVKSIRETVRL